MNIFKKIIAWLNKILNQGQSTGTTVPTTPPTTPIETTTSEDEIDPKVIEWQENGVPRDWKITAKIMKCSIRNDGERLTIERAWLKAPWPELMKEGWDQPAIGNWWIIGNVDGKWYGTTMEWLGPNKTEMGLHKFGEEDWNSHSQVLATWKPVKGEKVGFMQSTFARGPERTTNERTNIVVREWPV